MEAVVVAELPPLNAPEEESAGNPTAALLSLGMIGLILKPTTVANWWWWWWWAMPRSEMSAAAVGDSGSGFTNW